MIPFDSRRYSACSADHLCRAAGLLNLLQGRLGKQVRLHRDLARQLARAENLEAVAEFLDHAQLHQAVEIEGIALELFQPSEIDDGDTAS